MLRYASACLDKSSNTISACSPLYIQCWAIAEPAYGAMYLNDAGNDAGAATIVVYSIAPASSSEAWTCAIVEPLRPMATYTHLTAFLTSPLRQLSRWLMI